MALVLLPSLAFSYISPNPSETFPTYCQRSEKDFRMIRYGNVAICNRNVASATKKGIYERYGVPASERKNYTIDHLVPLSMGGSNYKTNLWPQHKDITTAPLEADIYHKLVRGEITHAEALEIILTHKLETAE